MLKQILKGFRSGIAGLYDCFFSIPQSYSFFIFGTHGVGLHSLLYYVSLMKTYEGKQVLPSSMFTFRRDVDLLGDLITLRFQQKMLGDIKIDSVGKWGITFDGGAKNTRWIEKNITKQAPAIVLVRDPLLSLTSFVNFEIFLQIQESKKQINLDRLKKYMLDNLTAIIGYKSNVLPLEQKCSQLFYVDCIDLQGNQTFETTKKIVNLIGGDIQYCSDFQKSINSPLQRYFSRPQSRPFLCGELPFYLSSLSRVFHLLTYPDYIQKNRLHSLDLDLAILREYDIKIFTQERYLDALCKRKIELENKIVAEMKNFQRIMKCYNQNKLDQEVIQQWLDKKHIEKIYQEIAGVPIDICKKWHFNL